MALSAYTHRAVDNALLALREIDPGLTLIKAGNPGAGADRLRRADIRSAPPRKAKLDGPGVIAGTPYALARLPADARFHVTVFDEAGQIPIPHAIAGMLLSRHWLFFGDHRQLPPVITAHHADREVTQSVFERLHDRYGSELLDITYRMNDQVCEIVGSTFYDGRLRSDESVAARRMKG